MLNYSNPIVFSPQTNGQKTVKEILDETAKQLENGEFSNQPEIKVELEQIIAECYFGEGNYALGSKHTEEYLDLHRKLYGEDDAKTLVASEERAFMLFGEGKLTESEKHYRKILPLMRNEKRKGNIKAENLADALDNFGYLRRTQGDSKEAELLFRKILVPSHLWSGDNLRNQAISYYEQGRYAESLSKVTETLKIYRESFGTHYDNYPTALIIQGL